MKKLILAFLMTGLMLPLAVADDVDIEFDKPYYGVYSTVGIFDANGDTTASYGSSGEPIDNKPFTRFGGWIGANATVEERTSVSLLMGMNTWNSQPLTEGSPFTRMQSSAAWLGHAFIEHKFGDVETPFLKLKLGHFHHSYSSSKNLGGHLFTGGTYPGHLSSNWWNLTHGNDYVAQGLLAHFSFLENSLNIDVGAFFERWLAPNYDISPSLVASYNFFGWAEIGAGFVFSHLISWDKDAVTPKDRSNAFIGEIRLPVEEWGNPGLELTDTLIVAAADPRYGQEIADETTRPDLLDRGLSAEYITVEENGIPNSQLDYYTFAGTKAMGRLDVTPFSFGSDLEKVKFFLEATLLGVKDYPFYYEKKSERMPILFGIHLPLPSGFDVTIEAEHYKNKFKNHIYTTYVNLVPQWEEGEYSFYVPAVDEFGFAIPDGQGGLVPSETAKINHENGEWMWSLAANKTFGNKLTFRLKIARDYLRMYNFFGNPSNEPAFQSPGGYYLAFKTELGIF